MEQNVHNMFINFFSAKCSRNMLEIINKKVLLKRLSNILQLENLF